MTSPAPTSAHLSIVSCSTLRSSRSRRSSPATTTRCRSGPWSTACATRCAAQVWPSRSWSSTTAAPTTAVTCSTRCRTTCPSFASSSTSATAATAARCAQASRRRRWIGSSTPTVTRSTTPAEVVDLIAAAREDVDVVQGWKHGRGDAWYRKVIGRLYHHVVSTAFGLRVRDVDCDFRLMRRPMLQSLEAEQLDGDDLRRDDATLHRAACSLRRGAGEPSRSALRHQPVLPAGPCCAQPRRPGAHVAALRRLPKARSPTRLSAASARRIAAGAERAHRPGKRIEHEHPPNQRLADVEHQLDRLGGLDRADHTDDGTENSRLRAHAGAYERSGLRNQAAMARCPRCAKRGDAALEALAAAMDDRHPGAGAASLIASRTSRSSVASMMTSKRPARACEPCIDALGDGLDVDVRVDRFDPSLGGGDLRSADGA